MAKTSKKTKAKHQDFQKVKLKVGKRLPKGQNVTNASFKSRSIQIKEQLRTDTSQPTTKRKLNLNDLLSHCQHYNTNMRHDALKGLKELLSTHRQLLHSQLSPVLGRLSELFLDKDPAIRSSVHKLLKFILPQISANQIAPFFPVLSAHLCCAMTHIDDDIQHDSLTVLDLCLENFPSLMTSRTSQLLPNFVEQISRRSHSGKSGSRERSLLVNPSSKLWSQKWRVKVLARLHRFLLAMGGHTRDCDVRNPDDTAIHCGDGRPMCMLPLGSSAVGSLGLAGYTLSNSANTISSMVNQTGCQEDLLADLAKLKEFTQTLVPLLLDCWVEVGPSQLSSDLPGNALSSDGLSTLSSVLGVLLLLLQNVGNADSEEKGMQWIQEKYLRDFSRHFMPHFPFCMHERLAEKSKGSSAKSDSSQISVLSLNLTVCEVMSYFVVDARGQFLPSTWFDKLVSYVTGQLAAVKLNNEQALSMHRILQRLVNFPLEEEVLKAILEAALNMVQSRHPNSTETKHFVRFFSDLVLVSKQDNFLRFASVSKMVEVLPEMLAKVVTPGGGQTGTTTSFLLETISRVVACGHPPMLQSLQSRLPVIISHLPSLTLAQQRSVVELLYGVPTIDRDLLRDLCCVCRHHSLGAATVQYIVEVLHARYLRGGNDKVMTDADYLSFLMSLLIGYSTADLERLSAETCGSPGGHVQLAVVEKSAEEWNVQGLKSQCAAQALKEFPSTRQLWPVLHAVLGPLLSRTMSGRQVLPLLSAVSLLHMVTGITRPRQNIDGKLLASLARLAVAVDTFVAVGTEEQAKFMHRVTLQKHEACVQSLHLVPGLYKGILSVVHNAVLAGSSLEVLQPSITMLTEYLGTPELHSEQGPGKAVLHAIAHQLETRFEDVEACEWWHSFKYLVSLL